MGSISTFHELPEQFGRYRILKKLGEGGMGVVYFAHDLQLDRPVALKIPHWSSEDPSLMARFQREARAAASLHHPNICPVFDVGEINGVQYLTMPYIEGTPLTRAINANRPMPVDEAIPLVRTLALALAEAHARGVIHRDLKPSNILINDRGEPIIMDFGLARRRSDSDPPLTHSGAFLGTPAYMSPEQVRGEVQAMGPGCDIYALGVLLFELCTGRRPFEGSAVQIIAQVLQNPPTPPPPPSRLRPGLDARLDAVCLKAMAHRPEDRYASMSEFALALSQCRVQVHAPSSGGGVPPPAPTPPVSLEFSPPAPAPPGALRPRSPSPSPPPSPPPSVQPLFADPSPIPPRPATHSLGDWASEQSDEPETLLTYEQIEPAPPAPSSSQSSPPRSGTYAGFGPRSAAVFVDITLTVLIWIAGALTFGFTLGVLSALLGDESLASNVLEKLGVPFDIVFYIFVWVIYHAALESSRLQATPGKLAMRIKVTDQRGRRLSFIHSLGRAGARVISALPLGLGFLPAAFTSRRQALHDLMTGTLVLNRS
jgi:serine/threonine protein kinase